MHQQRFIGFTGEAGAGKGTVVELLTQVAKSHNLTVGYHRFSSLLERTLKDWDLDTTLENYNRLVLAMETAFKEDEDEVGVVTRAIRAGLLVDQSDLVFIDGVRMPSDQTMLRSIGGLLVYVTASPKTRHGRTQLRKEKAGEGETTLAEFLKQEQAETRRHIPIIGRSAGFIINNEDGKASLKERVETLFQKHIA